MLLFSLCTSFFSSALNLVCPASLFFFFLCLSHLCTHHAVTHSHFITAACRPSRSEAPGCQCFSFESANGATRGPRAAHRLTALTDTHTHRSPPASEVPVLHKHPSASLVITLSFCSLVVLSLVSLLFSLSWRLLAPSLSYIPSLHFLFQLDFLTISLSLSLSLFSVSMCLLSQHYIFTKACNKREYTPLSVWDGTTLPVSISVSDSDFIGTGKSRTVITNGRTLNDDPTDN